MGKKRVMQAAGPRAGLKTTRIVLSRERRRGNKRLAFCEAGMGAPVIMIHGLGGSCRWWFRLFPELTSDGFRVLAVDLPGFGHSHGPALPFDQAARAVVDLADHLGLSQFFLCGHSMGGAIAAQLAADFGGRVRRLVLVDSAGIPAYHPPRVLWRLLQPWSWCPPHFYRTLIGDAIRAGPRNMARGSRFIRLYDIRPALQRVRAPSLVIWGEKDGLVPIDDGARIAEKLAEARFARIDGARHLPMISNPSMVSRLMIDFFREEFSGKD